MKQILKVALCFALLASGTAMVEAQGLGGLIKKGKSLVKKGEKAAKDGKEVLGIILGDESSSSENSSTPESMNVNPAGANGARVIGSSGIVIYNPLSSFIEIEPLGLYGVSKSENFGDAYLVLLVKKLIPQAITRFGNNVQNQKMIAVDYNGKIYNVDSSGQNEYDTPEGLIVRAVIDVPGLMFKDIRKDVNMMQQVKFGVFSDNQHQGNVTLNNVPIFWDVAPE